MCSVWFFPFAKRRLAFSHVLAFYAIGKQHVVRDVDCNADLGEAWEDIFVWNPLYP